MGRLIYADALKELRHNYIQGKIKFDGNEYDLIDKCPTVDAVEVVRCKDCKRRYTEDCLMQYTDYSEGDSEDGVSVEWTDDDDFCSYGERRDSDG